MDSNALLEIAKAIDYLATSVWFGLFSIALALALKK
tara:strand:- start:9768 stop:9875 length:108 start_codon:yes stop_codon:yes gene_type:complete